MSSTVKLKQGDSGTELDLNVGLSSGDAAVGWNIEDWLVKEAEYIEGEKSPLVTETMDLLLKGSSHDDLATRKQSMHQMQIYANRFVKDRTFTTPVWLHVQTCGETNERRTLVHSIKLEPKTPSLDTKGWIDQNIGRYRATIVREPYWEATSPISTLSTATGISTIGGEWDFTTGGNTVVGDVPARLYRLKLIGHTNVVVCNLFWIGFRSDDRHTDLDDFPVLWEAEDASTFSDDTSEENDDEASGGKRMTCDFDSQEDWEDRVVYDLADVTSSMESAYGKYLVLLRARTSDSDTETWVKLEHRLRYDLETIVYGEVVEVSSGPYDSYEFYSLGIVNIPLRNLQGITTTLISDTYEKGEYFTIIAKRTSGSGDLYMDCLVFIPVDEYFMHLENAGTQIGEPTTIAQCPKGDHWAVTVDADEVAQIPQLDSFGIGVPIGNTRLYLSAGEHSDDDDAIKLEIQYYPRWLSIRGAE